MRHGGKYRFLCVCVRACMCESIASTLFGLWKYCHNWAVALPRARLQEETIKASLNVDPLTPVLFWRFCSLDLVRKRYLSGNSMNSNRAN